MSKFTPGPWQINGSHIYTADPERALLAQVFNSGERVSDYPLVENARLIAAAPELYNALEEICDCPQWVDEATVPKGGIEMAPQQVVVNMSVALARLEKARAALAKARGEE